MKKSNMQTRNRHWRTRTTSSSVYNMVVTLLSAYSCSSSNDTSLFAWAYLSTPPLSSLATTKKSRNIPRHSSHLFSTSTEQENEHMKDEIQQMRKEALRRIEALHDTTNSKPQTTNTNGIHNDNTANNNMNKKKNGHSKNGISTTLSQETTTATKLNNINDKAPTNGVTTMMTTKTQSIQKQPPRNNNDQEQKRKQQQQRDKYSLLDGTCWKIMWNIGRKLGEETTMPKTWGISGERLLLSMELEFADEPLTSTTSSDEWLNGMVGAKVLKVIQHQGTVGPSLQEGSKNFKVENGGWRIAKGEGPLGTDIIRFFVNVPNEVSHIGGDVYCPKGRVYCSCGYFPLLEDTSNSRTKESLRQRLDELGREYEQLNLQLNQQGGASSLSMWDKIVTNKRLLEIRIESGKLTQRMNEARVREPDNSVLRKSKCGTVGLTREGGVCCRISKGLSTTYPTLGKFGIASIDKKPQIQEEAKSETDGDDCNHDKKNYLAP